MSFGQSRRHGCSSAWLKSVMGNHLRPRNIVYCSSVSRHVGVFCRVYLGNNEIPMMNIGDSDRSCQSCMVMYRIGWIIICIQLIFIYMFQVPGPPSPLWNGWVLGRGGGHPANSNATGRIRWRKLNSSKRSMYAEISYMLRSDIESEIK